MKTPKLLACSIVISLAKGTVSATFNVGITANGTPTSPTGKGQISGGSGAYKGARGDFAFKDLNKAGTNTQLTLAIR